MAWPRVIRDVSGKEPCIDDAGVIARDSRYDGYNQSSSAFPLGCTARMHKV
jgi:hypothetical protein